MKKLINSTELLRYYPDRLAQSVLKASGFRSYFIETTWVKHHIYAFKGKGTLPPLFILHGGADSAATYIPVLLRLRSHFSEIIVVESGGHGLSDDPVSTYTFNVHYNSMFQVLDKLIAPEKPAILLGNSLGGLTALRYAIHSPVRVKGLFLTSPVGAPMTDNMLKDLRDVFTPKSVKEVATFTSRVRHTISRTKAPVVNRITYAWITRRAFMDLVYATTTNDCITPQQLKGISAPVYMICGESDRIIAPNTEQFFKENISNITTVHPVGLGHCPHIERPKLVIDSVVEFSTKLAKAY